MNPVRHPVAMRVPRQEAGRLVFRRADGDVVVEGDVAVLEQALRRCDGTRSRDDVLASVESRFREAVDIALGELERRGVVVDAGRTFLRLHADGDVPAELPTAPPPAAWRPSRETVVEVVPLPEPPGLDVPLGGILDARVSAAVDRFRGSCAPAQLAGVLDAAYGATSDGRRHVPSAGGLWPLAVHAALRRAVGPMTDGLWWFDPETPALHRTGSGAKALVRAFTAPSAAEVVERCGVVVMISADLERTAFVYGNRGYRYALMEVGAAMQNIVLVAAALDVACRPLGGFDDAEVVQLLGLPNHVKPLIGIALG